MSPPKKKRKIETMQCPRNPVSFEEFKKLIKNLPDICFEVQRDRVAGRGVKTLDECALWYYESFYRDPKVRQKYPFKLSSCPKRIRDNLLSMPESEPVGEPVTEREIADGVLVKVARMGQFVFPVTFFAFKSLVNLKKVLRLMGMTKEERRAMMADEKQCEVVLKKFYNTFYIFRDRQSTDIFQDISPQLLQQVLKHAEPCDELAKKSVEKHDAEKRQRVVSFEEFEKFLENIYEIVWQLKMNNKQFEALGFDTCARALYLTFYVKPEIREKYTFKWRPCSIAMQKRLLSIPSEETAQELRESLYQLVPNSPNEEEVEAIDVEYDSPMQARNESISAADDMKKLLENNNNCLEKQPTMPPSEIEVEDVEIEVDDDSHAAEKACNSLLNEAEADDQLLVTIKGVIHEFPVTFNRFLRFINFDEVMPQLVKRNKISKLSELQLLKRFYTLFYVDEKNRNRYKYSFSAAPPVLKEKLLAMAKPLNQPVQENAAPNEGELEISSQEIATIVLDSSEDVEEEPFQTDVEVNIGTSGRFLFPVSFDTFRRCINYAEIIRPVLMLEIQDESQLADLIPHPQNPICEKIFLRFYRSFYVLPDSRQRFQYRFSCPDHRVLKKLTEYAKPLDERAIDTVNKHKSGVQGATNAIPTEQKKINPAEEAETVTVLAQDDHHEIGNIKDKEIQENIEREPKKKAKKLSKLPVTFNVFKRCVRNLNEILNQMKLCDEYKDKSDTECAKEYYKEFYRSSEMRNKFECKFKPCPTKMRETLLSYAQQSESEGESEVVCLEDVLPEPTKEAPPPEKSRVIPAKESKIKEIHEKPTKEASPTEKSRVIPAKESKVKEIHEKPTKEASPPEKSRVIQAKEMNVKEIDEKPTKEAPPPKKSRVIPLKEIKVKEIHENHVSFRLFKSYLSNLNEIVQQMLLCDEHRGKSEEECAREYYNGFYSSQNIRDAYPYKLKPCPAKMKSKLISFPSKDQHTEDDSAKKQSKLCDPIFISSKNLKENILITKTDEVEVDSICEIPVLTEVSNNFTQTPAKLEQNSSKTSPNQKNIKTLKNGASFEFPVSYTIFKRHINYDEIVKLMLQMDDQKDTEQSNRGKKLFHKFFSSFYIQKDFRQTYPYRFKKADKDLLKKLNEYAVPLNDMARKILSDQAQNEENKDESRMAAPCASKDETLITISGVTYRFPVSFSTFRKYINYEELKVGLAMGPAMEKKSPEQLAEILGDEKSCMRLLRSYYHSFYIMKNIRNKLKYNFNAAPPELSDKLLKWATPIDQATQPVQTQPQIQPKEGVLSATDPHKEAQSQLKQGVPNASAQRPTATPVALNIFLMFMQLDDVVTKMKQEPKYSAMSEDKCKFRFYQAFYTDASVRDKYPFKIKPCSAEMREILLMPPAVHLSDHTYHIDNREARLARPQNLRQYINRHVSLPEKQALLGQRCLDSINANKNTFVPPEGVSSETGLIEGAPPRRHLEKLGSVPDKQITSRKKETTSEKGTESRKSNKSLSVPKQVIESNSSEPQKSSERASEPQKSSERALVTEKTTTQENQRQNATSKTPEDANTNGTPSDSTKKPESSSDSPSQDQLDARIQKEKDISDSRAAWNLSPHQLENLIIVEQAKEEFFAKSSQDHNMAYLICTSQGLKRTIWRILYQLTMEEFKTYTNIHNGEVLYRNDGDLQPFYQHVVDKGNWPLNLYVRLPLLRQLLYSKGVNLGRLSLGQLSPKMLHWRTAEEHTNLDQIVEMQFKDRTGKEIDDLTELFEERERLYAACWRHDQWIYEVPQILSDALQDESCIKDLPLPDLDGIVLKSLPMVQSEDGSSQTEIISLASSSDVVPDSQSCPPTQLSNTSNITSVDIHSCSTLHDESSVVDPPVPESIPVTESGQTEITCTASSSDLIPDSQSCPPTQLNISNFVDIASVDIHSQVPETPHDPLASQSEALASVKKEPVKFLNNLRAICDTASCQWENIGSEEQIVNLDSSQEEGSSLSCFAIQNRSDKISPYQSLDSLLTATMFEGEDDAPLPNNFKEMPKQPVLEEQPKEPPLQPEPFTVIPAANVIQWQVLPLPKVAESRKQKLPESNVVPSKRIRLINDKVPQLRHEFRPLALAACNRIDTENLRADEPRMGTPIPIPQPEVVSNNITPSQDFALGNSLLESSQLAPLLDSIPPGVTVRKVNEKQHVNKNVAKVTVPKPSLRQRSIFRRLERFHFFAPLTTQQIVKHRIEGYMQGAAYQSAILKIDGKVYQVRGSLLKILFPHISPVLLSDLERVLANMQEFVYSSRWRRVQRDSREDLRKRVLFTFMETAPEFAPFLLHFETVTREWATCTEIGRWDPAEREAEPRPRSLGKVISAGILEKMRELNQCVIEINEE